MELPDPEPGTGQVLVRVHAVACNFPDILVCQGKYRPPGRRSCPPVEDVVARVTELTGSRGADVIYDPVGGDIVDLSRRVVAFEGRIP